MKNKPVVAIDGPSGAGKSTVAKGVAKALSFSFIDTGALYRTIALLGMRNNVKLSDGPGLAALAMDHDLSFDSDGNLSLDGAEVGNDIRTPDISLGASAVAALPEVRDALFQLQRRLGADGGVVLEGRDIGTVVFPDAQVKFYLTASVKARAARRHLELLSKGQKTTLEQVELEQEKRDKNDSEREISPLRKAADAVEILCDDMTAEQVITAMKSHIIGRFPLT